MFMKDESFLSATLQTKTQYNIQRRKAKRENKKILVLEGNGKTIIIPRPFLEAFIDSTDTGENREN